MAESDRNLLTLPAFEPQTGRHLGTREAACYVLGMTASVPAGLELQQRLPSEIKLDPDNPRLRPEVRGGDPDVVLQALYEDAKLDDLGRSIADHGYLPFDPIVAISDDDDKLVVREGNRRVATLHLLINPELAPSSKRELWRELAKTAKRHNLAESPLPILVGKNRDAPDLLAYIGFRHVSGILEWNSFSKANYIAGLVARGLSYREVARELGSRADAVERHYVAHQLAVQARKLALPGHENLQQYFGFLLRALNTPGSRAFIGVDYPGDSKLSADPVPSTKSGEFAEFVKWTFGTDEVEAVVKDSRQLTQWGLILRGEESIAYLRSARNPTFARAAQKAAGGKDSVLELLAQAGSRLEEAVPHIRKHKDDENLVRLVDECTDYVTQMLQHLPQLATKHQLGGLS